MAYVAGHGFPVPTVHVADGPDLVMDRVDGPTMVEALVAGKLDLVKGGAMLAELHRRLHAVPPQSAVSFARVVHLDLHPENVMLTASGPVVIDWRNATEGDPGFDVSLSALILAEVVVNPAMPVADLARELLGHFVTEVDDDPVRCLPQAVVRRELNRDPERRGARPPRRRRHRRPHPRRGAPPRGVAPGCGGR